MKLFRMLGLAALVASAAMALFGSGSAMAESTALCLVDPGTGPKEVCPKGKLVTHLHESGSLTLLSSAVNVECEALHLAEALKELAAPLVFHDEFTYSSCSSSCTIEEENGPSEITVLKTGHETAITTLEWLLHVTCAGLINCRYNGEGLEFEAKGPLLAEEGPATPQVLKKESGIFCPKTTELDLLQTPLSLMYLTN